MRGQCAVRRQAERGLKGSAARKDRRRQRACRLGAVHLNVPDLAADADAYWAVKDEVVVVEFAATDGEIRSSVGANRYRRGDALVSGMGDRWCVSRERFDAKYQPVAPTRAGQSGGYRNLPLPVRAKRIPAAFSVERSAGGDILYGEAGDWLVQYAPGDHGIVAAARFATVYRIVGR